MDKVNALELCNLTKKIKRRTIVDGISLNLYPGEVVGLLGPNGAGKTTTIRMLLGLIMPTSGEVKIYGKSLSEDFEGTISYVGAIVESPEFYKHLSGYQNLLQYSRMYTKKIPKTKIDEVVSFVGLNKVINNRVRVYSLGMRQRLGLAQALLHDPKVLILDEPTNGLDPSGIHELRYFLRNIASEKSITVLVSSHILTEMQLLCDRVAIINNGKLVAVKTIREINNTQGAEVLFKIGTGTDEIKIIQAIDFIKKEVICANVKCIDSKLIVNCTEELIPIINKCLVNNGIDVYAIENSANSLESQYLEIVKGATSNVVN